MGFLIGTLPPFDAPPYHSQYMMSSEYSVFLRQALDLHGSGNLEAASVAYRKSIAAGLAEGRISDIAFSNYGALLKEQGNARDAAVLYRLGERLFPKSIALLRNHANLLFEEGHAQHALARYLEAEQVLPLTAKPGKLQAIQRQQASALVDLGFPKLALDLLEPCLASSDPQHASSLRLGMAELYLQLGQPERAAQVCGSLLSDGQPSLGEVFQQCNLLLQFGRPDEALHRFDQALSDHEQRLSELDPKIKTKFHSTSWNFALMLLRRGLFARGWQLYEHGRWVPNGRGGMQRTVFKLHSASKLPEWDGSSLAGQRLLVNGEQGIGDVMMFSALIPSLLEEAEHIGILTYDRLKPIYQRSFPSCTIYDTNDFKKRLIPADQWTLQTPVGSIPNHRFNSIDRYATLKPFLKFDPHQAEEFRLRYCYDSQPLIGFSWRGGGNAKQKRTKSLRLDDFLPLFQLPGLRWISLQYGNVNEEIKRFSHHHDLNLFTAEDVDPLKDMDRWLSLVGCCSHVVSAANTTIHGSGSIGVPTTVILGRDPDWRWLGEHGSPCYWYPCVQIVRQRELNAWAQPINEIKQFFASTFNDHANLPKGLPCK